MFIQQYGRLHVSLDGQLLKQQSGVRIEDRISRPCAVTVFSALPDTGPEFDARAQIGEVHEAIVMHVCEGVALGEFVRVRGKVVSAKTSQAPWNGEVLHEFTIVDEPPPPRDDD